ncbi:hypothetical protein QZH41_020334 [Actinostola sp. cb2023]|nr:hypothetical protein QZH41_020334 [Actinostola sp. cb2023]
MADETFNSDYETNNVSNQETDEEKLEKLHFKKVLEVFLFYKEFTIRRVTKVQSYFNQIPSHHRDMLPDFSKHIKEVRRCIDVNQEFLQNVVQCTEGMFENREAQCNGDSEEPLHCLPPITGFDMDKINTTLKQFVRDWGEEVRRSCVLILCATLHTTTYYCSVCLSYNMLHGKCERDACYTPIIEEIRQLFPPSNISSKDVSILIPGAGLGRLMFEIAKLGYKCQGNEWSLYMLFASHYILNRSSGVHDSVIHPYVSQWCNVKASADQVRPIRIPDIDPRDIEPGTEFSMAAGNFLDVYSDNNYWDCIATCFFIDTGHNVIAYIEHIWDILKPGGYWINLGEINIYNYCDYRPWNYTINERLLMVVIL